MLFKKPIKTLRSAAIAKSAGGRLVIFPKGIQLLKAAQKEAMKTAALTVNLSRGFAETHASDEARSNLFVRKR